MPSRKLQKDNLSPKSYALESMNELRDWEPTAYDSFNISNVALQSRKEVPQRTKLIVTHDMAGGYNEDEYIQGNNYREIYFFQHWHLVDYFIYFAHKRVSIPPVNWVNACHRNGVPCLGTFIVEGNNQIHELEALLGGYPLDKRENNDPLEIWSPFFADKLVNVAKYYGFDGWLINIECDFYPFPTSQQYKAQQLSKFLRYLTDKMHAEVPNSKIIWYDSMTIAGKINWQNQLTDGNEVFFSNADGMFLNYWWKKGYPAKTRKLAEKVGKTGTSAYFGTDVWGRGTYAGGGFDSYKAIKVADAAGTSSALFGIAWTYEHFNKVTFEKMDRLLWYGGRPDEYPPKPSPGKEREKLDLESDDDGENELANGHVKGIADVVSGLITVGQNWLATNFDRGFGTKFFYRGTELLDQPWSHLSHQAILPNLDYRNVKVYPEDKNTAITCSLKDDCDAFNGGTVLAFTGQRLTHRESDDMELEAQVSMYKLELDVGRGATIQYTYRTMDMVDGRVKLIGYFELECSAYDEVQECLAKWQKMASLGNEDSFRADVKVSVEQKEYSFSFSDTFEERIGDWVLRTVRVPTVPTHCTLTLKEIKACLNISTAGFVDIKPHVMGCIGHLNVIPTITNTLTMGTKTLTNLTWEDLKVQRVRKKSIAPARAAAENKLTFYRFYGTLSWAENSETKAPTWEETDFYIIYHQTDSSPSERQFLGTAFCPKYRVSGLEILDVTKPQSIVIEAVNRTGIASATNKISISIDKYLS